MRLRDEARKEKLQVAYKVVNVVFGELRAPTRTFVFKPGKWYKVNGSIVLCWNGFHTYPKQTWGMYGHKGRRDHRDYEIWECLVSSPRSEGGRGIPKQVSKFIKLVRRVSQPAKSRKQ